MKIILSKSQWESIGISTGWIRIARFGEQMKQLYLKQGIEGSIVDRYIQDFDVIRRQKPKQLFNDLQGFNIPKDKRHDITSYTNFKDLEVIVDYVKGQRQIKNNDGKTYQANESANKIYEENNLIIYRADNAMQAIDAKGDFDANWCVSAQGTNNMFNSYKYTNDGNEPTFYFVKDLDASKDNPYRFFVIQALKNGYIVTSANNDGENPMSWEEIVEIQPKLDGKENIIKWIPIPQETKERLQKYEGISDNDFKLLDYEQKKEYVEYFGLRRISDEKFIALPDDLKNLYINLGLILTETQLNEIKNNTQLYDRYVLMWVRKIKDDPFIYDECPVKEGVLLYRWANNIKEDPYSYKNCPDELKYHPKIQESLLNAWVNKIKQSPIEYEKCPDELKYHPKIQEVAINGWGKLIEEDIFYDSICPLEFKNDPEMLESRLSAWIDEIQNSPNSCKNCPPEVLKLIPDFYLPSNMKRNQITSSSRIFSSYFNDNYIGELS